MAEVTEESTSKMVAENTADQGRKRKADSKIKSDIKQKKVVHETDIIFAKWLDQWKQKSCKYTSVDFSMHSSNEGKSTNFMMISQNSMSKKGKNKIMLHYKNIPKVVEYLQKCYSEILAENTSMEDGENVEEAIEENELEIGLYKKNLALIYSQMMNNLYFLSLIHI